MTKFFATTAIRYGKPVDENGVSERIVFKENEEVKGLPKEVMAELWEAGSLRMEEGSTAEDPRIEAARHASMTGEGVDNELTNPEKGSKADAERQKMSKSTGTSSATGSTSSPPKGASSTGRANS